MTLRPTLRDVAKEPVTLQRRSGGARTPPRGVASGARGAARDRAPQVDERATPASPRSATEPVVSAALPWRAWLLGTLLIAPSLGGLVAIVAGMLLVGVLLLLLGVVAVSLSLWAGSPSRLAVLLGGRLATYAGDARLVNLVEATCVAAGLPVPVLRVLEDPAPNAIVIGRAPSDAVLVVTTGLLTSLDRIELEAVVAHELSHIKRGDMRNAAAATRAVGLLALLWPGSSTVALRMAGAARESLADQAAVRLTRYPPALSAALEKLAAAPSVRPGRLTATAARLTAAMWCAPLEEARMHDPLPGLLSLGDRAAALREL